MKNHNLSGGVPASANVAIEGLSVGLYVAVGTALLAAARHGYLAVEGVFNSTEDVNALSELFKMGALGGLARLGVYGLQYIGTYQEVLEKGLGDNRSTPPNQG